MKYCNGINKYLQWWQVIFLIAMSLNAGDTLRKSFGFTTLKANGIDEYDATIFSQSLRKAIEQVGVYSTLEFSDITIRLAEQNLPNTCFDAHCSVVAGQILGADYFGFGSIGKVGKVYTLSMQVVEVRSGRIIRDISEFFKGKRAVFEAKAIPRFAYRICGIEDVKKYKKR